MYRRPISAAYLERKLRAIVGVQGSNPLPELADISGLVTLEDDRPEWRLAGTELFGWGRESQAAVAAQFSWVALRNPVGSGVVAVLEAYKNESTAAYMNVNYNLGTAPLPGVGGATSGRPRDSRAAVVLACDTAFGASAAAVGDGPGWFVAASGGEYLASDMGYWVLGPGSAIVFRSTIVNVLVTGAFHWYERPIEGDVEIK